MELKGDNEPEHRITVTSGCLDLSNLETPRGRRNHVILILIVALTPVFALIGQNIQTLVSNSNILSTRNSIRSTIQLSIQTGNVVHRLQIERGTTAFYISSQGSAEILKRLQIAYNTTDEYIGKLNRWPENDDGENFKSVEAYTDYVLQFRNSLNLSNVTVDDAIDFYSSHNTIFISWFASHIQKSTSGTLWSTLVSYHFLALAKEQAGIERARGSTFFSQGKFNQADLLKYSARKVMGENYLLQSSQYSTEVYGVLNSEYIGTKLAKDITYMRNVIIRNNVNGSSVEKGDQWFSNMTSYIDILQDISLKMAETITATLSSEIGDLESDVTINIVIVVIAVLLCPFVIVTVHKLTNRIRIYAEKLQQKTRDLEGERRKSEMLLYELLPVSVANKLLQNQPVEPENYVSVTLFFSDIVGFTKISSQSTPLQIVNMLNILYKTFDNNLELYDVYKVETIGDAYMVASGLPVRNGEKHVTEIGHLALDLLDAIANLSIPHMPKEKLKLRIGLNSGPVVTGVVGNKMPRYCVFGDTVNTASRMESSSLPHRIQISSTTKQGLDKSGDFTINTRGEIEVKGKGLMTTYWLVGRLKHPRISVQTPGIRY
ncbi:hypothetical protein LOTGIDRAFT_116760 [Lottia gigantea]|uniref:guanylate cyclase n=1 Tax=Lottia gigantea TaxID=225164 RepID=V4C2E4_LOTGI|nr:hypothetical protein LOTGIDRAFT_116760 [Lottia gigantea]ESO95674.1 hypothetical protein LOTGIDRAFT_116760 [Lottia gigantea]